MHLSATPNPTLVTPGVVAGLAEDDAQLLADQVCVSVCVCVCVCGLLLCARFVSLCVCALALHVDVCECARVRCQRLSSLFGTGSVACLRTFLRPC